jgi:ABC-2 type transport system ATP-binding protein
MAAPSIHVSGLTKVYKSTFSRKSIRALDDLDLTVESGEIFGLLGPNGAGKTTLIKILLSVVRPSSGMAKLNGVSIDRPASRRCVGFLPENHRFPDFLTPDQMLEVYGRLSGVQAEDRRIRIPKLLEQVKLTEWHDTKIRKFSKGMMQRVGIAQALINDPDIIFLDEPTDGVDPIGRREIRDILFALREQGKTIFLNSHLLSEVEQTCTRVAIMHKGRKIQEGRVEDLTRIVTHFDIQTTLIPTPLLLKLKDRFSIDTAGKDGANAELMRFRLNDTERSALNTLIDLLRQGGVEIGEVRPVRRSLEERFVEEVKEIDVPADGKAEAETGAVQPDR